jgi:hypothetical protein
MGQESLWSGRMKKALTHPSIVVAGCSSPVWTIATKIAESPQGARSRSSFSAIVRAKSSYFMFAIGCLASQLDPGTCDVKSPIAVTAVASMYHQRHLDSVENRRVFDCCCFRQSSASPSGAHELRDQFVNWKPDQSALAPIALSVSLIAAHSFDEAAKLPSGPIR